MSTFTGRPRTAARMFVIDRQERVLLMHERRDIGSVESHWITPGGGVEGDESLIAAASREVYEETGLRISLTPNSQPIFVERVFETLSYFDGVHFAARATAPALYSVGLMDDVCPPSTVYAAYNRYGGPKTMQVWPYNRHEGGGSHQAPVQLPWLRDQLI